MKRRKPISGETAKKLVKAHALFVLTLTVCAFFRIAMEADIDANTITFATILAIGVIIALSIFNSLVLEVCNGLNDRWRIVNYFIPGILIGLIALVLRVPVETFDVVLLLVCMWIANLLKYSIVKMPEGN
jgi:hypothetical protein